MCYYVRICWGTALPCHRAASPIGASYFGRGVLSQGMIVQGQAHCGGSSSEQFASHSYSVGSLEVCVGCAMGCVAS